MKKAQFKLIGGLVFVLLIIFVAIFFYIGNKSTEVNSSELIHQAKGELIFKPQFVGPSFFQEGMASYSTRPVDTPLFTGGGATGEPLRLNLTEDLSGFISSSGEIFPPIYKSAYNYSEGLAAVSIEEDKYGAIDKKGNWVISPNYAWLSDFKNGLAQFKQNQDDKYGYLNKKGEVVIEAKFESAGQFSEKRALVCEVLTDYEDSTCGFIDEAGTPITDFVYSNYHSEVFSEGLAKVCQGKGKNLVCGYINLDGKIVYELTNDVYQNEYRDWSSTLNSFSGGLALYGGKWFDGIQKWGFMNKKFELQIPMMITKGLSGRISDPYDFSGDIQWQTLGTTKDNLGQSAAIDKFGKIKFYSTYDEIGWFSQGLSAVRIGNKWGFINQENELVVEAIYDDVRAYEGGFASVRVGDKWGVIN
jgi:hypothetical protein